VGRPSPGSGEKERSSQKGPEALMADTSKNVKGIMSKRTAPLTQAEIDRHDKKKGKKKVKAGSYNKRKRQGYEDMLKEADKY
jgi:hypothetical protein